MTLPQAALGIDTSAYTTSVALLTLDGMLLADERIVLTVAPGSRGLRQSEAVFQHVRNLPALMERVLGQRPAAIAAVAASTAPRPVSGSYMPVFKAGETVARSVAAALGVPFVPVSHQEGHVWAGLWSTGRLDAGSLVALHLSGGTTELLRAEYAGAGRWRVVRLGGTEDLNAGQFIDRVGVALGLPFPAGPHLERLAAGGDPQAMRLPVSAGPGRVSFSGPTTAALRALEKGASPADLAAAVQECVAESLAKLIAKTPGALTTPLFLGAGGVLANARVRARLEETLAAAGVPSCFAAPRYSVDNAVGVALAAVMAAREGMGV
ncbi:MAG: hypothetical protein BAA04_12150 [Firmicutes bacterium ZCTH02-B6]|nr:MAG: hypothetical protein BAA04_12150 [Firmicutes bacterium ZCTH02-B6]